LESIRIKGISDYANEAPAPIVVIDTGYQVEKKRLNKQVTIEGDINTKLLNASGDA
jgi:hypothetical protein